MSLLAKDPRIPPQTDSSAPADCFTKPNLPVRSEREPPNDQSAAVAFPGPSNLLTPEQERVMAEHLPMVRAMLEI
jgi:hypothetical protein